MSASKTFVCDTCDTEGKIIIRTDDVRLHDIIYCPVCGADILEEDDSIED